ncbi:MAG: efflux RND transporter permease subunit [Candidatus Omnitrophica bacterium]|nr:efflux RND transporter permease subunit [Candidatus Omnitrophota bacterium]
MTLSDISIKNPVFAWMLMAALILFGFISYGGLGVSRMPEVDFPVVSVQVDWEGAAPEIMESDVTDIVEDAVMSVQGIREVSSTTRQGVSEITIEFDLSRDIDVATQEVQAKVTQAQRRLPVEIDPPVITKVNPTDQPILWLGVSGTRSKRDLMAYVEDHLKNRFQTLPGVGDIILGGFVERNLRVWVSQKKLEDYQLSVNDVIDSIEANHVEKPAGRIETPEKEMNVRAMGEALSVGEFKKIVISKRGGQPVYKPIYLEDVAEIQDDLADQRRLSRIMGRTAVGLGIRKQRGANEVEVARAVKRRLKEVQKEMPRDLEIGINFDRSVFVEESIHELVFTLALSALLTALVCWVFLGHWSSTLNVLLAIPTSILGTFMAFKFLGFTLNTFTVLGLSLVIGIVVDDAIMVLENIVRRREGGEDRRTAAAEGARQIASAALATTLALIAVFLPVAFMKGIIGKFFFQFGVTISVAVFLSLLEALTLTPMRASQFLDVGERRTPFGRAVDGAFKKLSSAYRAALPRVLDRKGLVIVVSVVLFAGSLFLFKFLRKEFVPAQDQSMFMCRLKTPVGSSIEFTSDRFKQAESYIMSLPETRRYFGAVGGFGGGEVNSGILFVTLKPKPERGVREGRHRPMSQEEIMTEARKALNKIPDTTANLQDLSTMGFTAQRGYPIEFTVRGTNWEKLAERSEEIMRRMKETGLVVDIDTDYLLGVTEIQVVPDRQKALAHGIEMEKLAQAVNALVGGVRAGKYTRDNRRYDIRVRLKAEDRLDPERIKAIQIWNNRGEMVRLGEIVEIREKPSLMSITRRGRERAIGIFSNVAPKKSQADAIESVQRIAREVLPEGYRIVMSGSSKEFGESFGSLFFALWLGILIAYMVLASQYNSYVHPLTVLLALPFSVTGAALALFLAGQSLNIYSLIALILLMGIVKKNSILLVEFANEMRRRGLGARQAILEAGPVRLRPILMTSVSTIAAALPPALALGPGAETRIPMAVAVIGGVLVSTTLILFVVPCAYLTLSKWERARYTTVR